MCLKLDKSLFSFLRVACRVFPGVRDSGSFPLDVYYSWPPFSSLPQSLIRLLHLQPLGLHPNHGGREEGNKKDTPPPLEILQEAVKNTSTYVPLARIQSHGHLHCKDGWEM